MVQTGENAVELEIEDVTLEQGNWRVSAYLSGQVFTSDLPPAFAGDPADFDGTSFVDLADAEAFADALGNAGINITADQIINGFGLCQEARSRILGRVCLAMGPQLILKPGW